jgi:hypothetical protein
MLSTLDRDYNQYVTMNPARAQKLGLKVVPDTADYWTEELPKEKKPLLGKKFWKRLVGAAAATLGYASLNHLAMY